MLRAERIAGQIIIQPRRGWIEVASIDHPPGEVVVSMRPVCLFANSPASDTEQLLAGLRGQWCQAAR